MTVKEKLYNNAVERIISEMPDNLSDMEKARYIYVSLGKLFCFDEKYMFGKAKTEKKIYRRAVSSSPSFSELEDRKKRKAICVSISKTLCAVLNQVGIQSATYRPDLEDGHELSTFTIDGNTYYADLTADLRFIHLNLPTRHFAATGKNTLSPSEVEKIDDKVNYSYSGLYDINDVIQGRRKEISAVNSLGEKLGMILDYASEIPGVRDLETVERNSFYKYILDRMLAPNERTRVLKNTLFTQENDDRDNFTSVYTAVETDATGSSIFTRFLYSDEEKKFVKISDNELQQTISSKGYHIYYNKKIPGLGKKGPDFDNDDR